MKTPTAAITRHGASGRATKKMAGKTTSTKRIATKSSGGTSRIPQSITTKLKPQMVATRAASRESRRFTPPSQPDHDHAAPANDRAWIQVASLHDRSRRAHQPPGRGHARLGHRGRRG